MKNIRPYLIKLPETDTFCHHYIINCVTQLLSAEKDFQQSYVVTEGLEFNFMRGEGGGSFMLRGGGGL